MHKRISQQKHKNPSRRVNVLSATAVVATALGCGSAETGDPSEMGTKVTDGAGSQVVYASNGIKRSSERLTRRPLSSTDAPSGFWEYLPPGYGDGHRRPLLVFWHGRDERGNGEHDLDRVLVNGPPRLISKNHWPSDRPFIVLSPQYSGLFFPGADEIQAFIAWAMNNYDVDPTRVYLTAISGGAVGAWNYIAKYQDAPIAAFVSIAGYAKLAWGAAGCDLGRMPIWAFHGDKDSTVPPEGTIEPMRNLEQCPSPPRQDVKMTIYRGVGHDSWSRTYDMSAGHNIYDWMLRFRRK